MSKKSRNRSIKLRHDTEVSVEPVTKPKTGPGQVFRRELIGAETGHAKRYRNIAATPLGLAYETGKLATDAERAWLRNPSQQRAPGILSVDRKDCGEKFEEWYRVRMGGGTRDSSQPVISSGGTRTLTETQEHVGRQLAWMREKMSKQNYMIVEAFCGEGWSMIESLRKAGVEAHPVGTAHRVREALDDLVCVMTGRQLVPMMVPADRKRA